MNINLREPSQYVTMANSENRNGCINRLTVCFGSGDVTISDISQLDKHSISWAEFDGRAYSFTLPEVLTPVDMAELATLFLPLVDAEDWQGVKDTANDLWREISFCEDYIDCCYTAPCTDDEWNELAARHDNDPAAIEKKLRECGADFIGLTEYITGRLSSAWPFVSYPPIGR